MCSRLQKPSAAATLPEVGFCWLWITALNKVFPPTRSQRLAELVTEASVSLLLLRHLPLHFHSSGVWCMSLPCWGDGEKQPFQPGHKAPHNRAPQAGTQLLRACPHGVPVLTPLQGPPGWDTATVEVPTAFLSPCHCSTMVLGTYRLQGMHLQEPEH